MIRYYYRNSLAKKLGTLEAYHPGSWVHVSSPTEDETNYLAKQFKLDIGHITDALDPDEVPRIEKEGDLTYIFVRYPHTGSDGELTTLPLLFVIGPELFVTVSQGKVSVFDKFMGGKMEFVTTGGENLLTMMLEEILEQYEQLINRVGRQIKNIRSRLKGQKISNQDFVNFVLVEDELNEFLSAMMPVSGVMRRILRGGGQAGLISLNHDDVEDLLLNNEQSIENCKSHIKSIVSIREAYATISSNNLNQSMKVLTAATVFVTLPNVFYSMYGMNIDLPFQREPWAYIFVMFLSVGLPIAVLIWAKWRRIF
jgi:magnesium transporter